MPKQKALTLVELLIAIIIFGLMIGGIWAIESFARYHLKTARQRAKLQNEVSFVIEHVTKNFIRVVGNAADATARFNLFGSDFVSAGNGNIYFYYVDSAEWGSRTDPGDGTPNTGGDHWELYLSTALGPCGSFQANKVYHFINCSAKPTAGNYNTICGTPEDLTPNSKIVTFDVNVNGTFISSNNYADIDVSACWDPSQAKGACGTPDNPSVTMKARVKMPMVSTH